VNFDEIQFGMYTLKLVGQIEFGLCRHKTSTALKNLKSKYIKFLKSRSSFEKMAAHN
jgi:hypothetical protein